MGALAYHCQWAELYWIFQRIGGQDIGRDRATEFSPDLYVPRDELMAFLNEGRARVEAELRTWTDQHLDQQVEEEGFPFNVRRTLFHLVQHEAYHVGQMALLRFALA